MITQFELDKIDKWCKNHPIEVSEIFKYFNDSVPMGLGRLKFHDLLYKKGNLYLIVEAENSDPLFPSWRYSLLVHNPTILSDKWREVASPLLINQIETKLKVRENWELKQKQERYEKYLELKREFE